MNNPLSNKKKKLKRNEAQRRAILWSERELRKRQLKAQKQVETITLQEKLPSTNSRPSEVQTIISWQPNNGTVSSLQQTIRDFKVQRQELDTTIKVLTQYLNQLTDNQSKSAPKKRNKPDHGNWLRHRTGSDTIPPPNQKVQNLFPRGKIHHIRFYIQNTITHI